MLMQAVFKNFIFHNIYIVFYNENNSKIQVEECFFETICKKSHYERNDSNNVKSVLCYNHHIHTHIECASQLFSLQLSHRCCCFFNLSFSALVLHPFKQILHLSRFPERGNFLSLLALQTCSSLFKT